MSVLIIGGSGTIGSHLLQHLAVEDIEIRALTRDPDKAKFPGGVVAIKGDMLDVDATRDALKGATTLFLLNAVTAEELTQTLLTLNLAREAGIERLVYFSVFQGEAFANVPHFTAKHAAELMIEQLDIPATILRPNCFMQNDVWFKDALLGGGVYPFPIGVKGVSMVDARDVAKVAALAILERERAGEPLPHRIVNIVGPDVLTGDGNTAIWSDLLSKPVRYGGDDTAPFEAKMRGFGPSWSAMDLRLMLDRFQQDGMRASDDDVNEMTRLLGRPPRRYIDFARETLATWQA
ncbi:MAG: SDR family oxidoreductase [Janthinobacterium lividum]